ncbi:MAG: rod shape-determining protein MreC [Clostridia bacterium]
MALDTKKDESRMPGTTGGEAKKARPVRPSKGKPAKPQKPKRVRKHAALGRVAFALLVTLAIVALGFFLLVRDQGKVGNGENMVGSIFAPVQNAVSSATQYVRDLIDGAKDYAAITEAYELQKQEVDSLKLQLVARDEDALENERLTQLLGAKDRYEAMKPVYARVIARDPGVWFNTFSINRGTKDGVNVNMSVITGDGLVGRVYEVGLTYAKVLSVIDSRSAVACLIERTRDNGVMRGQISSTSPTAECNMYYLPVVNDIMPGDVVLTSGVDTLYPKGLTVGTVASVSRQSDLSDQYIVVLPAVDFQHVEEVLVLRTVVERDTGDKLPIMPTPTPRPTPVPTPTPEPTANVNAGANGEDVPWYYPSPVPGDEAPKTETDKGSTPSTPAPSATYDPDAMPPEDAWTM